eukprot:9463550-Pyramimonas_sp.AAC.1
MIGAYAFLAKVGGRMHRSWVQDGPGQNRCMCIGMFLLGGYHGQEPWSLPDVMAPLFLALRPLPSPSSVHVTPAPLEPSWCYHGGAEALGDDLGELRVKSGLSLYRGNTQKQSQKIVWELFLLTFGGYF